MDQKRESPGTKLRRDVTAQRADRAGVSRAPQTDSRWKAIIDCSDLAIVSGDLSGKVDSWNPAAERVFGYTADEMIGGCVSRLIPADRRGEFAEVIARVSSGEAVSGLETRRVRKDGRVINVLINVFPLRDWEGAVFGIAGLVRDITDRKRLQGALRQSERLFQDVASQMREVVWITSADGLKVYYVNAMYERLWDRPRAALYEHPQAWLESVHPEDRSRVEAARQGRCEPEALEETIYRVVRSEGDVRWARDRRFPILERGSSRTDRVAVLTEDITQRVTADRAAVRRQERLRSLASELVLTEERERRRLAEALHDCLGQSLSLARIKLGELRQGADGDATRGRVHEVMTLLDGALASVQNMTFDLCPPGLHDLGFIQATHWLAEDLTARFGMDVDVRVTGKERPIDEKIRVIVFRSMRELLINVAKHAGSASATVSLRLGRASLEVTVSDHGAGFEPEEAQTAVHQPESFGLFSVRQHLVELGGNMEIETAPGAGTRVVLTAPLSAAGRAGTRRSTS